MATTKRWNDDNWIANENESKTTTATEKKSNPAGWIIIVVVVVSINLQRLRFIRCVTVMSVCLTHQIFITQYTSIYVHTKIYNFPRFFFVRRRNVISCNSVYESLNAALTAKWKSYVCMCESARCCLTHWLTDWMYLFICFILFFYLSFFVFILSCPF